MEINIKVLYKLIVSFLMVMVKHAQSTQNSKFVIYLQYLKKEEWDEVDFMHADKIKLSYKVIPFILVGMARSAQITQNSKFAKSLQYLKKEVKNEFDFSCNYHDIVL